MDHSNGSWALEFSRVSQLEPAIVLRGIPKSGTITDEKSAPRLYGLEMTTPNPAQKRHIGLSDSRVPSVALDVPLSRTPSNGAKLIPDPQELAAFSFNEQTKAP